MSTPPCPVSRPAWPRWQQWLWLVVLSAAFAAALEWLHIPAALMLGPMGAGICIGLHDGTIQITPRSFHAAQSIIGCMVAATLSPGVIAALLHDGWMFLFVVVAAIVAGSVLGAALTRLRVLPGTTAVWGTTPGAASTMVIMAEAFGADARLVAFMQYLRVLFVAVGATAVARLYTVAPGAGLVSAPHLDWFAPLVPTALATTFALALAGCYLARHLHVPAGQMLVPLALGAVLQGAGLVTLQLPIWLLALAYAGLGWHIGLGFDRASLRHASRALPMVALAIVLLMAFCGLLGWLLVREFAVDPLTAYLATSPGGLDTVAVIAASTPSVDIAFVMTLQTLRLLLVMAAGPAIARYMARHNRV